MLTEFICNKYYMQRITIRDGSAKYRLNIMHEADGNFSLQYSVDNFNLQSYEKEV